MSARHIPLDAIAAELVTLAIAEYEAADTVNKQRLDIRLAPVRATYAPEGGLNLVPTVDGGWAMLVESEPEAVVEAETVKE